MANRAVEAADLFRVKLVGDPNASPDGTQIAYTVTNLDEKDNDYKAAIWIVNVDGGEPRRLTSGRFRDGQPRWSPDGQTISFTSTRKVGDKRGQIWTIAVDGGEAKPLTKLDEGVGPYCWSPDGRWIAAASRVRVGEHNPDSDVRVITTPRYRFDGEGYLDDKYAQIFLIDASTGEAKQLTSGAYNHSQPAFSPSGAEIAFQSKRQDNWEFSAVQDIWTVRISGGALRKVTDSSGSFNSPTWSPDGSRIACYGTQRIESDSPRSEVWVVPAAGGAPESLTSAIDRNFSDGGAGDISWGAQKAPLWSSDGTTLAAVYAEHGQVHLARIRIRDKHLMEVTKGVRRFGSPVAVSDNRFGVLVGDAVTPNELYVCGRDGRKLTQLTNHNQEWLDEVAFSKPEDFWVKSADGREVHGWIMKPHGFEEGKQYPLILEIHGGPFGMYGESLFHEFQLLAAQGYVVLYTNPRGSTGYGDEWAGLLFRGWGKHDMPDLMAAVDWAIAQGYVDPERLGVTGGSYGGFMTNWVIGQTDRFKAAVTGRCISNMYSMFGTDDIFPATAIETIGALPWDDPEIYYELSPITYVDKIVTPLLIEHQEEDYRCPIEQAEQLFIALKRLGQTVEMVRFPDESHGMSRTGQPKHRIERLKYMTDWFAEYI